MNKYSEEQSTIGNYCSVGDGAHASIKKTERGVPYITAKNILGGRLEIDTVAYISENDFAKHFKMDSKAMGRPQHNDVIFSIIGTIGQAYVVQENDRFGMSSSVAMLRPNTASLTPHYLYYWITGPVFQNELYGIKGGVAQGYVSLEMIKSLSLAAPPLPTQQKIASILSAYDDLIENNNRRIQILEEMAQGIYREWFVHFRFPGHENVNMVDSELGKIPEGWAVSLVENAIDRYRPGKLFSQKTVKEYGKVPVLDQGRSGIIGYHDEAPGVDASVADPIIVFANHTCYQRLILFPFSAIQNVLPFKSNSQLKRDLFWLHYSTKDLVEFNDYKGHWPEFISKKIVVPSIEYCDKFGELLRPIYEMLNHFESKNQALRKTRDLLLPRLISGRLDVEELDIEV